MSAGSIYLVLNGVHRYASDSMTGVATSITYAPRDLILFFSCILSILATFFAMRYDKMIWGVGFIVMIWLIAGAMLGWGK